MYSNTLHLSARTLAYFILSSLLLLCSALPLRTAAAVQCAAIDFKGVLVFFLGNYVAHAATVPFRPGGKWMESAPFAFASLIYPLFGLIRAAALLDKHRKFGKDEIGLAIAQGAVMVAVRSKDWEPPTHDQLVFVGLPQEFLADTTKLEASENNGYPHIDTVSTAIPIIPKPNLKSSPATIVSMFRRPPTYSMAKRHFLTGTSGAFSTPIVLTTCCPTIRHEVKSVLADPRVGSKCSLPSLSWFYHPSLSIIREGPSLTDTDMQLLVYRCSPMR
jgi:hypothetical protein